MPVRLPVGRRTSLAANPSAPRFPNAPTTMGRLDVICLVSQFRSSYPHVAWTSRVRRQNRSMDARMSSADLVHRKGLGCGICGRRYRRRWPLPTPDGAVRAALDLLLAEQREEPLDLVDPGRGGRREVGVPAGPLGEPVADQLGLVARGIVHDDVDVEIGRHVVLDPSRNRRNSSARWRGMHVPMMVPAFTSRAANKRVVPWRL